MIRTIQSIPLTFYSKTFYADVCHRWKGIGLGFIVLNILFSYVGPLLIQLPQVPATQQEIMEIFDRLPDITIKDNKLSIDRNSPYVIEVNLDKEKPSTIIFDINHKENEVPQLTYEMEKKNAIALITSDFLALNKNSGIEVHNYSKLGNLKINHDQWMAYGEKVAKYFPCIFVVAVVPVFVVYLIIAFFKALFVKLIALFFTTRPELAGAMRLGAAASIPVSLISLAVVILGMIGKHELITLPGLAALVIWLGYVVFGLSAENKSEN